jgi:hypothetical protein
LIDVADLVLNEWQLFFLFVAERISKIGIVESESATDHAAAKTSIRAAALNRVAAATPRG